MARLIPSATRIAAAGSKPKEILEVFGHVNSGTANVSVAHMKSPAGWLEPAQTPEFDEYTYVLSGELHVEAGGQIIVVKSGQAIHTGAGETIRYSTPVADTEYIAICLPAFHPDTVHRHDDLPG